MSATVSRPALRRIDLPLVAGRAVYGIALLAQPAVGLLFWHLTWDDSAITLGFARTFAATGAIAPTPGSPIVEGYSTTLWMFLMAAVARLAPSPDALLAAAKLATILLDMAAVVLARRFAARTLAEPWACLAAAVFGLQLATFHETINGMEGPISVVLLLSTALLARAPGGWGRAGFLASGALFVLTRWEAAWLLTPFLICGLVTEGWRRQIAPALSWGAVFVASNLARWLYFGDLLPNTIVAKSGVPYTYATGMLELERHLMPLANLALLLLPWLAPIALLWWLARRAPGPVPRLARPGAWDPDVRLSLLLGLFALVLNLAVGQNWGPETRGFFVVLPFLVFLCIRAAEAMVHASPVVAGRAVVGIAALTVAVSAVRAAPLPDPHGPDYMPDTTVAQVRGVVPVLDRVRAATGTSALTFAGPDMGAVTLFADGVRVIDLGKLCDRTLAYEGYGAIGRYLFGDVRPDVIEVHAGWTLLSGIAEQPELLADYRVVYVDGLRLFLRRELIARIAPDALATGSFDQTGEAGAEDRARIQSRHRWPEDRALNRRFGSYLELR